jgi:hypothetical protein
MSKFLYLIALVLLSPLPLFSMEKKKALRRVKTFPVQDKATLKEFHQMGVVSPLNDEQAEALTEEERHAIVHNNYPKLKRDADLLNKERAYCCCSLFCIVSFCGVELARYLGYI